MYITIDNKQNKILTFFIRGQREELKSLYLVRSSTLPTWQLQEHLRQLFSFLKYLVCKKTFLTKLDCEGKVIIDDEGVKLWRLKHIFRMNLRAQVAKVPLNKERNILKAEKEGNEWYKFEDERIRNESLHLVSSVFSVLSQQAQLSEKKVWEKDLPRDKKVVQSCVTYLTQVKVNRVVHMMLNDLKLQFVEEYCHSKRPLREELYQVRNLKCFLCRSPKVLQWVWRRMTS